MKFRAAHCLLITLAFAIGFAVPACSLDPTKLPIPGAYLPTDPYRVKMEFTSALNLPGRAKVDSGGVQIGVLDRVELVGTTAVAHVELDRGVRLPKNTRAELRQATVLGDIYIAIIPPTRPDSEMLREGDTIPKSNTVPSTNIEDLLRSMSNLINGGSLNTLQETVNNMNKSIPPPGELMEIHQKITAMLHDMNANKETIDLILNSVDSIVSTMKATKDSYSRLLNEGPKKFTSLAEIAYATADLIIQAGELGRAVAPLGLNNNLPDLIQMISYITPAIHTASTLDTTIPVVSNKMVRLLREKLIPFFKNGGPKYTVTGINPPDESLGVNPGERADEVIQQMQTMGLVR